jgi:hypothetical protein
MLFPAVRRLTPVHSGISLDRKVLGIGILTWYFDVGARDRVSRGI